ncbi:phospholipid carrier-dependent glycosyltransferase [Patescibacteria group bacterium]
MPVSIFFWSKSDLSNFIQFPFRFLSIIVFSSSVLIAYLIEKIERKKTFLVIFTGLLVFVTFYQTSTIYRSLKYENLNDDFYQTNDSTTDNQKEYLPIWVKDGINEYPKKFVYIKDRLNQEAESDLVDEEIFSVKKKSDSMIFDVDLNQKSKIVFNQVYFPGWQLKADYGLKKIDYETSGLIEFELDKGKHHVEIKFRDTPIRRGAKIVSSLFFLFLLFYLTTPFLKKVLEKLSKQKNQKLVNLTIGLIITASFFYYLYQNRAVFIRKYDHQDYSYKYANSQYIDRQNPNLVIISDDQLYAYSGLEYVKGVDPTKVSFEHPPLGKYLIGLSIILFNNQNIVMIVMGVLVLVFFYLISLNLFKNKVIAGLLTLLLSLEPLFKTQLISSLLDLPQLLGIVAAYYFYLKSQKNKIWYVFFGISIGFAISVKYGLPLSIFVFCLLIDQFLRKRSNLKYLLGSLFISGLVFITCYFQFFKKGASVLDFVNFQKWVFSWFTSKTAFVPKYLIFKTIFLGVYLFWDQKIGYIYNSSWNYFWPFIYLQFIVMLAVFIKNRLKPYKYFLIYSWPILYLLFLIPGAAAERYLIIIMPFIYLSLGVLIKRYLVKNV